MDHATGSFLARGGVSIYTQTWRPVGDAKAQVVLVHGFGEHSGRYEHVAQALTDAGYVVATYDQRGHGRSGGPRALVKDMRHNAGDLHLFREELSRGADADLPQILLGHSMGGTVVLQHLVGDHQPAAAVVLSAPYLHAAEAVNPILATLAPFIGRFLPTLPTQKLPAEAVSRDADVVRAYAEDPLVYHGGVPAQTGAVLIGIASKLLGKAPSISEQTLIVHGTDDKLADVQGSRELAGNIGGKVELKTYPGLYHEVFNEPEQKEVLGDVIAWFDAAL